MDYRITKKEKEEDIGALPEVQNSCSLSNRGSASLTKSMSCVALYMARTIALKRGGWLQHNCSVLSSISNYTQEENIYGKIDFNFKHRKNQAGSRIHEMNFISLDFLLQL